MSRGVSEGGRISVEVPEGEKKPASSDTLVKTNKGYPFGKDAVRCFYCKKQGHIVAECPVLQVQGRRNLKPVNLVILLGKPSGASVGSAVIGWTYHSLYVIAEI